MTVRGYDINISEGNNEVRTASIAQWAAPTMVSPRPVPVLLLINIIIFTRPACSTCRVLRPHLRPVLHIGIHLLARNTLINSLGLDQH